MTCFILKTNSQKPFCYLIERNATHNTTMIWSSKAIHAQHPDLSTMPSLSENLFTKKCATFEIVHRQVKSPGKSAVFRSRILNVSGIADKKI